MAFREVTVIQVREVLRRWLHGAGERPAARAVGVDRKTARRYIAAGLEAGLRRDGDEYQLTGRWFQAEKRNGASASTVVVDKSAPVAGTTLSRPPSESRLPGATGTMTSAGQCQEVQGARDLADEARQAVIRRHGRSARAALWDRRRDRRQLRRANAWHVRALPFQPLLRHDASGARVG